MPPVDIQLRGYPDWTELEDLRYTIDECGFQTLAFKMLSDKGLAEVKLPSWEAADKVVEKLHKFEFTPGYPLQARVKPGQVRTAVPSSAPPKGRSKGSVEHYGYGAYQQAPVTPPEPAPEPEIDPQLSVGNCIGAGRIEGWFLNNKSHVDNRGFGHVQSYCFEGNLLFRPANSPLLAQVSYQQKDTVSFEVIKIRGQYEAVRLAPPDMEEEQADAPPVEEEIQQYESRSYEEDGPQLTEEPSWKSQKRREREESDARMVFFGNFGQEVDENALWRFAEQAGEVKKVKIFYNTTNWTSKGCGKVFYAEEDGAVKAINEIAGTVLNNRIVIVEPLGQSSNTKPKKPKAAPKRKPDETDDMPKQLPLSLFNQDDTPQEKLKVCYAAFEDLLHNHDPVASGVSLILMIRKLVMEVNDIFGEDENSLQQFAAFLRQYSWFRENSQCVKWQASKKRVNISKYSPSTGYHIEWNKQREMMVDQRKLEQEMMGKPVFELSEEDRMRARLEQGKPKFSY